MALTDAQKMARKVIREAARRAIAEVDASEWRQQCVEFSVDIHVDCCRYDKATMFGQPARMSMPIFYRSARSAQPRS